MALEKVLKRQNMNNLEVLKLYQDLLNRLKDKFGSRLKLVVLFGSRARGKVSDDKDHDIFLVIEGLPDNPVQRQKEIREVIWNLPLRINTISKTPKEMEINLTPFLLEVFNDGICLHGHKYFNKYKVKILKILKESGLKRIRIGREWYWVFKKIPTKEWELSWEGFREFK